MEFGAARELVTSYWRPLLFDALAGIESISVGVRSESAPDGRGGHCIRLGVRRIPRVGRPWELLEPTLRRILGDDLPFGPSDLEVVERGALVAAASPPSLSPGLGVANAAGSFPPRPASEGSVGFFVRSEDGDLYLVSCNHVLARCNRGRPGEPIVRAAPLQATPLPDPAALTRDHGVAELAVVSPVRLDESAVGRPPENRTDVAMARVTRHASPARTLCDLAGTGVRIGGTLSADAWNRPDLLRRRVVKVGAGSGATQGRVTDLFLRMRVGWGPGQAVFVDQVGISSLDGSRFSAPGDSGSAIVTDRGELLGLLFAVDAHGGAAANRSDLVLEELRRISGLRGLRVVAESNLPRRHPGVGAAAGP